jgi:phospholipase/carboxylesterase
MTQKLIDAVEVQTHANPTGTVIWLHGLGADGHDFEPAVPDLARFCSRGLRFVFPHAPVRPVSLNGGYPMRAWYDIVSLDRHAAQDEGGIRESDATIRAVMDRENERGIPTSRIVLAGFSQGGAMALFSGIRCPQKLAGIIGLSCYMLMAARFEIERQAANAATRIFLAHGLFDPVVAPHFGDETRGMLEAAGYPVTWRSYPMAHSVCAEEVGEIAEFLRSVLSP